MNRTLLHIGSQQTVLEVGAAGGPSARQRMVLPIGSSIVAERYFRHDPPTPGEIENAIMVVEDEVTRAREMVRDSVLASLDDGIRQLALVAGVADAEPMMLTLEAVEQTFDRLAAVSQGRPAASSGLPAGGEFAATLLILRELMHHLGFSEITLRAPE